MKRNMIPVINIRLIMLYQFKFLFWIVNKRTQFSFLCFPQCVAKQFIYLSLDVSRCILQYVNKCFILTMDISQKMFRTLRQIKDCLQIDNLRTRLRNRRKRLRKKLEIPHVFFDIVMLHTLIIC